MSEVSEEVPDEPTTHALTIQPIFVWEIQNSYKDAEFRSWELPKQHLGKWIALHSGKKLPTRQELADLEKYVIEQNGRKDFKLQLSDLVSGAIVGFIRFVGDVPVEGEESERAWLIDSLYYRLETPIPCNGQLGFWRLDQELADQLNQSLVTEVEFDWAEEEVE